MRSACSTASTRSGPTRTRRRWIAHLVRELLARETGQTLGIVAFSEAQQSEIERALERLGRDDPEFARRYDDEVAREEDGQVVGLFVKNLENVQGDERDIILMSVCYAAGPDGRMRMNFGPINNAGGEKRLNVIFSRARRHMVLVSSIDHTAITNTYNDGANTLRGFLHYADAVSNGDDAAAAGVLAGLRDRTGRVAAPTVAPIVDQIADAVRAAGVEVVPGVGQSAFRADLALRPVGAAEHTVGVLVDQPARLAGALPGRASRHATDGAALRRLARGAGAGHRVGVGPGRGGAPAGGRGGSGDVAARDSGAAAAARPVESGLPSAVAGPRAVLLYPARMTTRRGAVAAVVGVSIVVVALSTFLWVIGDLMSSGFMASNPSPDKVIEGHVLQVVAVLLWVVPVADAWHHLGRRAAGTTALVLGPCLAACLTFAAVIGVW